MNDEPHAKRAGSTEEWEPARRLSERASLFGKNAKSDSLPSPGNAERALPDAWWKEYRATNTGRVSTVTSSKLEARKLLCGGKVGMAFVATRNSISPHGGGVLT